MLLFRTCNVMSVHVARGTRERGEFDAFAVVPFASATLDGYADHGVWAQGAGDGVS